LPLLASGVDHAFAGMISIISFALAQAETGRLLSAREGASIALVSPGRLCSEPFVTAAGAA